MIDVHQYKIAMSHFLTGITVVTSTHENFIQGMTCNAFMSVSLNPPSILVSLKTGARTERLIHASGVLAVNILNEKQRDIAERFGGSFQNPVTDRFNGLFWEKSALGCPIFPNSVAHLDCRVTKSIEAHDHTLYLAEVTNLQIAEGEYPLGYCKSQYLVDIL